MTDVQALLLLTINIHDADAHDAGDDDQGETGSIVVHQQQPVDSSLHTKIIGFLVREQAGYVLQLWSPTQSGCGTADIGPQRQINPLLKEVYFEKLQNSPNSWCSFLDTCQNLLLS